VANDLRLAVAMKFRETSRDQSVGDIVRPSRDLAHAVYAIPDKVIFDEFYDFQFRS
jgi:hypothetical protein